MVQHSVWGAGCDSAKTMADNITSLNSEFLSEKWYTSILNLIIVKLLTRTKAGADLMALVLG